MPRTTIEPHKGDKRYVRFTKSQENVGRSLAADRRQHAERVVRSGEGDRAIKNGTRLASNVASISVLVVVIGVLAIVSVGIAVIHPELIPLG